MMNAFGDRARSSRSRRVTVPAAIAAASVAIGSAAWACTPSVRDEQTRISSCVVPAGATKPCKEMLGATPFPNADMVKGPAGSRITAFTNAGGPAGRAFDLVFLSSFERSQQVACYHASATIGGPVVSTDNGSRPPTSGTIPSNAPLGGGEVCFSDSASRTSKNYTLSTSSIPAVFKVIV